jgi:hypothetical protein
VCGWPISHQCRIQMKSSTITSTNRRKSNKGSRLDNDVDLDLVPALGLLLHSHGDSVKSCGTLVAAFGRTLEQVEVQRPGLKEGGGAREGDGAHSAREATPGMSLKGRKPNSDVEEDLTRYGGPC